MRFENRKNDALRNVEIIKDTNIHAEGSCLIKMGNTHVLCNASVEEKTPSWLKGEGKGWVTAEYGMLPRSTGTRMSREAKKGQSGRTQEIQRLIGRSLRAVVDLEKIEGFSITVDCDVIQADGGTRCASITGGYVALVLAIKKLIALGKLKENPIKDNVAAVSCGLYDSEAILDVDYIEDSNAQADTNFVLTGNGGIVEIQGTAEDEPFTEEQYHELLSLAKKGIKELTQIQNQILED